MLNRLAVLVFTYILLSLYYRMASTKPINNNGAANTVVKITKKAR